LSAENPARVYRYPRRIPQIRRGTFCAPLWILLGSIARFPWLGSCDRNYRIRGFKDLAWLLIYLFFGLQDEHQDISLYIPPSYKSDNSSILPKPFPYISQKCRYAHLRTQYRDCLYTNAYFGMFCHYSIAGIGSLPGNYRFAFSKYLVLSLFRFEEMFAGNFGLGLSSHLVEDACFLWFNLVDTLKMDYHLF